VWHPVAPLDAVLFTVPRNSVAFGLLAKAASVDLVPQVWQSSDKPIVGFMLPTYGIGCRYMKLFGKF